MTARWKWGVVLAGDAIALGGVGYGWLADSTPALLVGVGAAALVIGFYTASKK